MHLRALVTADRGPLDTLIRATGAFSSDEVLVALELIDESLGGSSDYRILVAELEGRVSGYACWGATPMTDGVYDLYWIAVEPSLQRAGVGRALLSAVEDAVRADGGRMVLIETASKESYAATRGFYERAGYAEVARVPDFYEDGDDKVIYARRVR